MPSERNDWPSGGVVCGRDYAAVEELVALTREEAPHPTGEDVPYPHRISAEMLTTVANAWASVDWKLPSGMNCLAIITGYGAGAYRTYAGYDGDGNLAVVVTDLKVLARE